MAVELWAITRPLNKVQKRVFVNDIIADTTCRLLFSKEQLNDHETGKIKLEGLKYLIHTFQILTVDCCV